MALKRTTRDRGGSFNASMPVALRRWPPETRELSINPKFD
jgi:hypothetical protein